MATNPASLYGADPYNYLATQPIQTIDPNAVYAAGLALAQQQMAATAPQPSAPVNALASAPAQAVAPVNAPAPAPQAAPVQNALAMPMSAQGGASGLPTAQVPHHGGVLNALGRANDYLAALLGAPATFGPWQRENDSRKAFAAWQANPDDPQARANFVAVDPGDAFNFTQQRQSNQLAAIKAGIELQQAQRAAALSARTSLATTLKGVADAARAKGASEQEVGQAVGAAYDNMQHLPEYAALGLRPGEHDFVRDLVVTTPGVLDTWAEAPTTVTEAGGANSPATVLDARTGRPIGVGVAGVVPMTSDQRPYATAGTDPSGTAAAGAAPGAGAGPPPATVPGAPGQPRGIRNNNGGNIRDGAFARSQPGYVGADSTGYAIFKTPGQGIAAQERLLMSKRYFGGGNNTVRGIVSTYLGNGAENSPASKANYIKSVSGQLGVDPDAPLSGQQVRPLGAAMRNFENGTAAGEAPITGQRSIYAGATAPVTNGVQGAHWLEDEAIGQLSPEALHQAAQTFVLTGSLPTSLGRGGVVQKQILGEVAKMGYSGPQVQAIQARHTSDVAALKQLGSSTAYIQAQEGAARANADLVLEKSQAVPRSNWPSVNDIEQGFARHSGDPNITALDTAIGTFVNQFATVMGNGTPTEGLRHEGAEQLNAAQSPAQLKGIIATMRRDMANRSKAFADTYTETSNRIGSTLPTPVHSPDEARRLPKGTRFITDDGRIKVR